MSDFGRRENPRWYRREVLNEPAVTAPDHEQAEDYWRACKQPGCRVRLVRRECPAGLCFEHLNAAYFALAAQLAEAQKALETDTNEFQARWEVAEAQLAEAQRENERLREALEYIKDCDYGARPFLHLDAPSIVKVIDGALAAHPPTEQSEPSDRKTSLSGGASEEVRTP